MIFGLLSLKHYFVHFARIGGKNAELSGKYIPKKFFSCHPRFALGSRFQFGFSRRIEAVIIFDFKFTSSPIRYCLYKTLVQSNGSLNFFYLTTKIRYSLNLISISKVWKLKVRYYNAAIML